MLKNRLFLTFTFLIILCISITACKDTGGLTQRNKDTGEVKIFDDAPCIFREYPGVLIVEEIKADSPGNEKENMVVSFQFEPETKADTPPHVKKDAGYIKTNSKEMARFGVKTGNQYQTKAEYIESGYCKPGPHVKDFSTWTKMPGKEKAR